MVGIHTRQRERDPGQILSGLAVDRRRCVLAELRECESISEAELARRLAGSAGPDVAPVVGSHRIGHVRTELHHVHLPKLADPGLVEWDASSSTVALGEHDALETAAVWAVVESNADLDAVLDCVADSCTRDLLSILQDEGGRVHRARLAAHALHLDQGADVTDVDFERALVSLRHEYLPRLETAGLVDVDGDVVVATDDDRLATVWSVVEALTC